MYLQRWHGWCHVKLPLSRRVLCTPYNHAPCHFMQSHINKVHVCLSVTCHLHFQQNDRDILRATTVTRGWNGYRNASQHRKSTLEKKILPAAPAGIRTQPTLPHIHVLFDGNAIGGDSHRWMVDTNDDETAALVDYYYHVGAMTKEWKL